MSETKKKLTVAEQIDSDEGFKSKRKLLTITSLVLLLLSFTDAKVIEANTFLVKLSFGNQLGLSLLLVLAVIFLLVRYYNFAYKYHSHIYKLWSTRMMEHPFFFDPLPFYDGGDCEGLICKIEQDLDMGISTMMQHNIQWGYHYHCGPAFIRKIIYSWESENNEPEYHEENKLRESIVSIGWKNYWSVFLFEIYFQIQSFFIDRESLDIYTPYALGFAAISSYFFNDAFQFLLQALTVR